LKKTLESIATILNQSEPILLGVFLALLAAWHPAAAAEPVLSDATEECIGCHASIHPGIVADWRRSRHAARPVAAALADPELSRRVSTTTIAADLQKHAVGCAECHLARSDAHSGTFEHNGYNVHRVVSPADCALCHRVEAQQYGRNIMSHAHGNLAGNLIYQELQSAVLDTPTLDHNGRVTRRPAGTATRSEACYHCHGTRIEVKGTETRETVMGEMEFPQLTGWPNQGVGRVNTDNSKGACTACHTRHAFSIAMARKPDTCKQCHVGPDVPAAKVYDASKHGNIYASMSAQWNFNAVPWNVGKDFAAPTCAACHMSLLVNGEEDVIVQRSHQMSDRLPKRLYGLIYAHAHPKAPDTTIISNAEGLPLPTSLTGKPATRFLVDKSEADQRQQQLNAICLNCHAGSWVSNHFKRLQAVITETNTTVRTATELMQHIWQNGWAQGLPQKENLFDEAIEKKWTRIWLFQANSIRFAAAMAGGGDYGVFADGRFQSTANLAEMIDWMATQKRLLPQK